MEGEEWCVSLSPKGVVTADEYGDNYIKTSRYTLFSFVPKVLWEQFQKVSNAYFLLVLIIVLIPGVSPIPPITSALPLMVVLGVSSTREAIEDYRRHKEDKRTNSRLYSVLQKDGSTLSVACQDLKVGDVVRIEKGQHFPADLVLLSSNYSDGLCYVETSNLDGETSLKPHRPVPCIASLGPDEIFKHKISVSYEGPNGKLYSFNGVLAFDDGPKPHPLSTNQQLLRGASLRNTKYIYGLVIYAGANSKLALNQRPPPTKRSTLDRQLNRFVFGLFIFQFILCFSFALTSDIWEEDGNGKNMWYLGDNSYSKVMWFVRQYLTFFVLFNILIPISLFVTVEFVKFVQAIYMLWDEEFRVDAGFLEGTNTDENGQLRDRYQKKADGAPATMLPKTSDLNDELGRIEYIFTDKTGTLTENDMVFSHCSVGDTVYDVRADAALLTTTLRKTDKQGLGLWALLEVATLCHTVVPEHPTDPSHTRSPDEIEFQAQSPDELALVNFGRQCGVCLWDRSLSSITIRTSYHTVPAKKTTYELLATLPFSSARRRMSVVVRDPETAQLRLLCKGADVVVLSLLKAHASREVETANGHLDRFSRLGLRTLVCATRAVGEEEFAQWKAKFDDACALLKGRDAAIEAVCAELEQGLTLVGSTAIEDVLQADMPETIAYLLNCGIRLWVLTGDKQETAVNIAFSSKLLSQDMDLLYLNVKTKEECAEMLRRLLAHSSKMLVQSTQMALVVDGLSLQFALDPDLSPTFVELGTRCKSVVCNRVTPLQKALVVRAVKTHLDVIALAVGDGANDVAMLQEANVGIGVFGKEGVQAAAASDYAIQKFRHLRRLLCVHGRYSFKRLSNVIFYSFYKNIYFSFVMFWFSLTSGYSGQVLYDSWIITVFNMIFTALPPFVHGIFEKDVGEDAIAHYPELYRGNMNPGDFTTRRFLGWILLAIAHSLLTFVLLWCGVRADVPLNLAGLMSGLTDFGLIAASAVVVTVTLKIGFISKHWVWPVHFAVIGSLVFYFLVLAGYCLMGDLFPDVYMIFYESMRTWPALFTLALIPLFCLFFDYVWEYVQLQHHPYDWQIIREKHILLKQPFPKDSAWRQNEVESPKLDLLTNEHTVV